MDLQNCSREQIHLPGGVQSHGAVVVARAADLRIVQASANVADLIPGDVDAILATTLDALLGATAAERLAERAESGSGVHVVRVQLPGGGPALDAHGFVPADGLLGIDLEAAVGDATDPGEMVSRVSGWGARLAARSGEQEIVEAASAALYELVGFDRAWAYRFEPDGHGVVVAETCRPELERFLGLHFPEGDIPAQARELYRRHGVRVIHDTASVDSPLVPLENPETGAWPDLSGSGLRAVSPIHIRYLQNMGVRSSMSVPLVVGGRLWGLLSAHHYSGARPVSFRMRSEAQLLGVMTSMQLASATELAGTKLRAGLQQAVARVSDAVAVTDSFIDGVTAEPEALLGICNATGAIVAVGGDRRLVGRTPDEAAAERILAAVEAQPDDLFVTEQLGEIVPAVADLAEVASGAVAFPLSRAQRNWVVWLRPESIEEVTWGNRDRELVKRDPSGELELGQRESFERWAEEVRGHSTPWKAAEVDATRDLRSALGVLLIARTERLARLNEQLARANDELDAFAYTAAHDLREPVRGVEQLADFLLEDYGEVLGADGREQLETIIRLADRMEGLLASLLDYAELGETTWTRTRVHLPTVVDEVRELLAASLGDETQIDVDEAWVDADESGLRQLLLNLIWNAVKYSEGAARISIGTRPLSEAERGRSRARRSLVGDAEPVAVFVRDEGIGIAPEHHERVFDLFRRLHGKEEFGGGHGAGLTLCRRIVARHGGVIWVDSAVGSGSTFWFTMSPA